MISEEASKAFQEKIGFSIVTVGPVGQEEYDIAKESFMLGAQWMAERCASAAEDMANRPSAVPYKHSARQHRINCNYVATELRRLAKALSCENPK